MKSYFNQAILVPTILFSLFITDMTFAQSVRGGGGGVILDDDGRTRQEDMIRLSNCRIRPLISETSTNPVWGKYIDSLKKKSPYYGRYLERETERLSICFTGKLWDLGIDRDFITYSETIQWELKKKKTKLKRTQLSYRLGDVIFTDLNAYEGLEGAADGSTTTQEEKTRHWIHEINHGIVPDFSSKGFTRSDLVSNLTVSAIELYQGKIDTQGFDQSVEFNEADLPIGHAFISIAPYLNFMHEALKKSNALAERHDALSKIPFSEILSFIPQIDLYRLWMDRIQDEAPLQMHFYPYSPQRSERAIQSSIRAWEALFQKGYLPNLRNVTLDSHSKIPFSFTLESLLERAVSNNVDSRFIEASVPFLKSLHESVNVSGLSNIAMKLIQSSDPETQAQFEKLWQGGLDPNEIPQGQSLCVFSIAAKSRNWPAYSLMLKQSDRLSDACIKSALKEVIPLFLDGFSGPIQELLAIPSLKIDARYLFDLYVAGNEELFLIMLPKIRNDLSSTLMDGFQGENFYFSVIRQSPNQKSQMNMTEKMIQSLPPSAIKTYRNGRNQNLWDVALEVENSQALIVMINTEPDVCVNPKASSRAQSDQTRALLKSILRAIQQSPSSASRLETCFTQITQADSSLLIADWQELLLLANPKLKPVITQKLNTFERH